MKKINIKKTILIPLLFVFIGTSINYKNVYAQDGGGAIKTDKQGKVTIGSDKANGNTKKKPTNEHTDHSKKKHTGKSSSSSPKYTPHSEYEQGGDEEISSFIKILSGKNSVGKIHTSNDPFDSNPVVSYSAGGVEHLITDRVHVSYDVNDGYVSASENDRLVGFHWFITKENNDNFNVNEIIYNTGDKGRYKTFYAEFGKYYATRKEVRKVDKGHRKKFTITRINEDGNTSRTYTQTGPFVKDNEYVYEAHPVQFTIVVSPKDCPPGKVCPVKVHPEPQSVSTIDHLVE